MIPLQLQLSGFLSYRDPTLLDFSGFDLACISGTNGAGKSTLLDAITWALFGQARRHDESLINLQADAAEVILIFRLETVDYRIQRSLRRGKGAMLELQARPADSPEEIWKPLTERTQKETQRRIEQILRLDYDTFVNASFFLQGKADLFTQQSPSRRKEVLGNILGMEVWEAHKALTAERRRRLEGEMASISGRLGEIETELAEEDERRARLKGLETELARVAGSRRAQTSTLESARKTHEALERQRALLNEQVAALSRTRTDLESMESRLEDRRAARSESGAVTRRAAQIEAAFQQWRATVSELERWDAISRKFQEHDKLRRPLLQEIVAEEARLQQELGQLSRQREQVETRSASRPALEADLRTAMAALQLAEGRLAERDARQAQLSSAREILAGKTAENKSLKEKMDEIKARVDSLAATSGASCPLCGQLLTPQHRESTVAQLNAEGKLYGDQYRANAAAIKEMETAAAELEAQLSSAAGVDAERLAASREVAQLHERLKALESEASEWAKAGQARLEQVRQWLESETFAPEVRTELAAMDSALATLGYDTVSHDSVRMQETQLRTADQEHRQLEAARAALGPLEDEIQNLESQIKERGPLLQGQEAQVEKTRANLDSAQQGLPDLAEAERVLFDLEESENRLNQEVGAARQKVAVLQDLRSRRTEMESGRQELALTVGRHKMLEIAFGKDGVPALLIEQALPEIQVRANEILDRLSDGRMSVQFETQAAYRDKKREDLRETLEIKISDGAGKRDYEMYSGGEAFRVNFAIRLALSQVLASRTGARLQTLVIDEGFGSQDSQGVQRLIETINIVRHDFAKILLISHLEELKDAFPTRIEVEKTDRGSVLKVV